MAGEALIPQELALGFIVTGIGVLLAAFPGPIAAMDETLDAVGSKRSGERVEPSRWKLLLTRVFGVGIAILGISILLTYIGVI